MEKPYIHDSVVVESDVFLGNAVFIRQNSHIRERVQIGSNTRIGRNVYIGPGVTVGKNCKIQNNVLIYEPSVLNEGVFIGPSVVLTNDNYPRAITSSGVLKSPDDWISEGVYVGRGASIGAGAICIAPLTIGEWAFVGAGSVVTKNVPAYALVVGNPARQIGWVGEEGRPLLRVSKGKLFCPQTGYEYQLTNSQQGETILQRVKT